MKTNWKDMSKKEKGLFIAYCILAVIGVVAAAAGADMLWMILVAVVLAVECKMNWNKTIRLRNGSCC